MSDTSGLPSLNRQAVATAQEFSQLSAEDQSLVTALIARLRRGRDDESAGYPPDVNFMDFEA